MAALNLFQRKNKAQAKVVNITRLRVHDDGEGVRSVIFLYGCPLRCNWCCNPETQHQDQYYLMDAKMLYGHIANDLPYFLNGQGGITFSGGEPLLHAEFLIDFIQRYCSRFGVDIETSLYADPDYIARLYPLIHEWHIDFKVFDPALHEAYTGVSNALILENLKYLARHVDPGRITITFPMIPGYNLSEENLTAMTRCLKSMELSRIHLHPYRKSQEDKHRKLGLEPTQIPVLTDAEYRRVADMLTANGFELISRPSVYEKDKCRYLKAIRKQLCEEYQIPLHIEDCTFEGRCIGTCPLCEHELTIIKQHLEESPCKTKNTQTAGTPR